MLYEIGQYVRGEKSNFAPEDANSNLVGAKYGAEINSNNEQLNIKEFNKYLQSLDPIDPKSEEISRDNVYLPEDESSPELEKRSIYDFLFPRPLDHLGSIRVVLDDGRTIVSANDYDMWGYYLENRTYNTTNTKNKFTGKERDNESTYDYFGARYYDARVGRWGQEDLLINKYPSFSPYSYSVNNPILIIDPDGRWIPEYDEKNNKIIVRPETNDNLQSLVSQLGISSEQFVQDQKNLGINNFDIQIGETSFDITQYVVSNNNYKSTSENSNCHGFVAIAKSKSGTQELEKQGQNISYEGSIVESPNSGDLEVFYLKTDWNIEGFTIGKDVPMHSAIYIIKNQIGAKFFLNRIDTKEPVSISFETDIFNLYNNNKSKYINNKPPDINNPVYYRGWEQINK